MEGLVVTLFSDVYRSKKVLVTGHTGFKGSWLVLWLTQLGANVSGISLDPETTPAHWPLLKLTLDDRRIDIRNFDALTEAFSEVKPDVVFHFAAQALVRPSYVDPIATWSTNVMGTAHLLEACRKAKSVKSIVIMTSDKCYENCEWDWGYRETDRLGGHDPYSSSKAAAELLVSSYGRSFFSDDGAPLVATARAGNVIGGGDWSEDRLIPDLVRAISAGQSLAVRSPAATRPWQHVLESLSGCLLLGQKLIERHVEFSSAWNFGPDKSGNLSVEQLLVRFQRKFGNAKWHKLPDLEQPHEAQLLYLDSSKAERRLGWTPTWTFDECVEKTASWYKDFMSDGTVSSADQLDLFIDKARSKGSVWAG